MALHDPREDKARREQAKQRTGKAFPRPSRTASPTKMDLHGGKDRKRGKLRL